LIGGACVGATLKLGSDSVGALNHIFQSTSPALYVLSSGNVGVGTSTPVSALEVLPATGYSILAGSFKIGNVALPTEDADAATKGYIDSALSYMASTSTFWDGSMTGNIWSLNSGNVGIGTTNPLKTLDVIGTIQAHKTESSIQDNLLKILSTQSTSGSDATWRGRAMFGAQNLTTIMGVYRNQSIIGTHSWTSADGETGPAWGNLYLNWDAASNAGGNVLMRGNVGIGTSTPSSALSIVGNIMMSNDSGTMIKMGINTDHAVADPVAIDMGGTYSNVPGLHPKIMMYKAGSYELGFGFSSGEFEYIAHTPGKHVFFSGTVRDAEILSAGGGLRLPSTGVLGFTASTANQAADSGISRGGVNKLYVGSGVAGNYSGTLVASNIGIGTTTPTARLSVVPASGYAILAGNFKIGNVALPTEDADAVTKGYVDSALSYATSSMTAIATYVGMTTVAVNGSNSSYGDGYNIANGLCDSGTTGYSGSHVCTSFEMLYSIISGITMPTKNVWIFVGPPAYTASANDCEGRTSAAAAPSYGAYWEAPSTNYPQGRGLLGACSAAVELACCR
jgi:hypothetical protein